MRELQAWAYQHVGNTAAEDELWGIVGRMLAAEREACAKIADEASAWCRSFSSEETAERIEAAIRARGETQ